MLFINKKEKKKKEKKEKEKKKKRKKLSNPIPTHPKRTIQSRSERCHKKNHNFIERLSDDLSQHFNGKK